MKFVYKKYPFRVCRRHYLKYLSKELKKIIQKRKINGQIAKQVKSINFKKSNNTELFAYLQQRKPTVVLNTSSLEIIYPSTVKAIISKTSTLYPTENEQDQLYQQLSFTQFETYRGDLQVSVAQMQLSENNVKVPDFVDSYFTTTIAGVTKKTISKINLWYYHGKRITTWHYDGYDNFLIMVKGSKVVYMMPPNTFPIERYLSGQSPFSLNSNHSKTPSLKQFSKGSQIWKCKITEGESLFIPRGWWHYIDSFGEVNIAVNIWGNSIDQSIRPEEYDISLRYLAFQIGEKICQSKVKDYQILSEQLKRKYREIYFGLICRQLLFQGYQ